MSPLRGSYSVPGVFYEHNATTWLAFLHCFYDKRLREKDIGIIEKPHSGGLFVERNIMNAEKPRSGDMFFCYRWQMFEKTMVMK